MTAIAWLLEPLQDEELDQLVKPTRQAQREKKPLACAACAHAVTNRDTRVEVEGAHQHTFANPVGLIFTIGCFGEAPGCLQSGRFSGEWSWFDGCQWRYAHCRYCHTHLGWSFRDPSGALFFGLILDRLVAPS